MSVPIQKIRDAIYGHLVADAVGTPYEFKRPSSLPPFDQIDMIPPPGFNKSWKEVPLGSWSDDGSQTLCLLEYYLEEPESEMVWHDRWMYKLLRWERGHLWCDNKSFDAGAQTQNALQKMHTGIHPLKAADIGEWANGNGSLMRALPTALMKFDLDENAFFTEVGNISSLTHTHPRSRLICMIYCEMARNLIRGKDLNDALDNAVDSVENFAVSNEWKDDFNKIIEGQLEEPTGSGYVVNSFWSALFALRNSNNYKDCVKIAIELGNDTDTTACIAGGLAGIIYGEDAIPSEWMNALRDKHIVEDLLGRIK